MPSTSEASSKSGILTDQSGERLIPASVRADGSTRKQIKIRPGYKPPEDVEVYKNRTAEAWKTRGMGGVPGAVGADFDNAGDSKASASNKNAKRRDARKKAKAKEDDEKKDGDVEAGPTSSTSDGAGGPVPAGDVTKQEKVLSTLGSNNTAAAGPAQASKSGDDAETIDPEMEKDKQAKRLQKRLRQAKDLMDKKEKGENLLPEQFEKVIKIQELTRQLNTLGFDANGERKRA
ncbi:MAG: hypothetical protein M1837_001355 [Sclerophora amabilis]|nr:MAG: hypothetical protein M1837_001355 [Sclerophora amabilis]